MFASLFCCLGATALAEGGCSVLHLKQAGGWASSTVAEHYIQESDRARITIANTMALCRGAAPVDTAIADSSAAINALTTAVNAMMAVHVSAAVPVESQMDEDSDTEGSSVDDNVGLILRIPRRV